MKLSTKTAIVASSIRLIPLDFAGLRVGPPPKGKAPHKKESWKRKKKS